MLIRPIPFPNEIARGYLGRVMHLNGATRELEVVEMMRLWAGVSEQSWRATPCLDLLSKVSAVDLTRFTVRHSTMQLLRGITACNPEIRHGCDTNREILWNSGMRLLRDGAYFCEQCVCDDQASSGSSYWHREHQIPGLYWCPSHLKPLKCVENKTAFFQSPAHFIDNSRSPPEEWGREWMDNKYIQRYLDICFKLLKRSDPIDGRFATGILRTKARQLGFHAHDGSVKRPLLSDDAIRLFGRSWLATVLPALAEKKERELLPTFDRVVHMRGSNYTTITYAVACALLYDSADEAIDALAPEKWDRKEVPSELVDEAANESDQWLKYVRSVRYCQPLVVEKAELLSAYVQAKGSYEGTVSLLPGTHCSMITQLRSIGLPDLAETDKAKPLRAIMAFYVEKRSLSESAFLGGISNEAMENLLRTSNGAVLLVLKDIQLQHGRADNVWRRHRSIGAETRSKNGAAINQYKPHLNFKRTKSALH